VLLVDANTDGGIEEVTEKGVRAGGQEYECDIIVFATGFDAMTGPLKALNLKGRGGRTLDKQWADGPHTCLGISSAGFPNSFTITGPRSPSVLSNMPVSIVVVLPFLRILSVVGGSMGAQQTYEWAVRSPIW
jgi:cation diffusion facilitator CzcD-associated flavoprotein CzcO